VRLAELLRLSAIGIALLGWLDPPVIVRSSPPVAVGVAVTRGPLDAAPDTNDGSRTRREAAEAVVRAIADGLGAAGEVRIATFDGPRLPCGPLESCVVVTDGAAPVTVPVDRTGPVSVVQVGERLSPNVAIVGVDVPNAHVAGGTSLRVTLEGRGVAGRTSRVTVRNGTAVVGDATETWTEDRSVALAVPWRPVSAGSVEIHLAVTTEGVAERTMLDNEWRGRAEVTDERWPVQIYERRPSQAVAFVRRVLEADPRVGVDAGTDLGPAASAATPGGRLEASRLDRIRVVVAGALETLTTTDVDLLERFVHDRGGALVLVPGRRPEGPVMRLLFHRWRERPGSDPLTAGELKAGEWLLADEVGRGDRVWVSVGSAAAVVSSPAGAGDVVVVGAMDAWRYHEPGGALDGFWRQLIAHLAEAAGPALDLSATGGEPLQVTMHGRSVLSRTAWRATAEVQCGDAPQPVRLWPAAASGAFAARLRTGSVEPGCVFRGAVDGIGEGRIVPGASRPLAGAGRTDDESLEAAVRRTGGSWLRPSDVETLVDELRALGGEPGNPEPRYPMRSVWWLVPLVSCLAGDWWLRRHSGRR
jgi:hypothetical protein